MRCDKDLFCVSRIVGGVKRKQSLWLLYVLLSNLSLICYRLHVFYIHRDPSKACAEHQSLRLWG